MSQGDKDEALQEAAKGGDSGKIPALLAAGAAVDCRDEVGVGARVWCSRVLSLSHIERERETNRQRQMQHAHTHTNTHTHTMTCTGTTLASTRARTHTHTHTHTHTL